jgi:hypothetical protein
MKLRILKCLDRQSRSEACGRLDSDWVVAEEVVHFRKPDSLSLKTMSERCLKPN